MTKTPRLLALLAATALASQATAPAAQPAPAKPAAAKLSAASTAALAPVTAPRLDIKARTLRNGLKVYSVQDKTTPNVSVQVWYGVGAKNDPVGRSGFAHLFEHLMFKSTAHMKSEMLDRLTEDVGGFNNAFTADDTTAYYEVVPANHLERLLWAEADRMGSLVVDDASFKSERDVVKEELRQSYLANPYGRLNLLIGDASYQVHPYKRPGIGSLEDLDAATLDDVKAFHATYYRPDDAALIVVGNFEQGQLDGWIDTYFAAVPRPAAPLPKVAAKEPPRTGPKAVTGYGPNVPLPATVLTWLIPAENSPDAAALKVADAILSSGKSSRLYQALVYEQQIAQSASSEAEQLQQLGLFQARAVMASGHTPAEGEAALRKEVARLRDAPVSPAELTEAKNEAAFALLGSLETPDDKANAIGQAVIGYNDAEEANRTLAKLQAVTAADVQRVARQYLQDDRRVTITYLNEKDAPAGYTPPKLNVGVKVDVPALTVRAEGAPSAPAPGGLTAVPAPAAPPQVTLPRPVERTLPNGLRVIAARSGSLPILNAVLSVRGGSTADAKGLEGGASMMAELLTEGAGGRSASEIASAIEALGGQIGAGAGYDSVNVSLSVLAPNAAPALAVMKDVALAPAFAPEELERQRTQRLDELKVAYSRPGAIAGFVAAPVVFGDSPYGHSAVGTPASLAKLTPAEVKRLHGQLFRPDNAVLTLTGGLEPERMFALAEQAFGAWAKPAGAAPTLNAKPQPMGKPRVVVVDLPGAGQAAVTVVGRGVGVADQAAQFPGEVANATLGVGFTSRLNQEIRIKRGLSYGARSGLDVRRDAGLFTASAQTKNESADEVAALMLAELTRLGAEAAPETELATRRAVLTGGFGREVATGSGLAGAIAELAVQGRPLEEIQTYIPSVEGVTPVQVQAFSRQVLDPKALNVVVVGDAKAFLPALQKRFGTVEVIPATALDVSTPTLRKPG